MKESYNKKVVIVTGSSRGIGAATIKYFAANNYNVVINYLNSEKKALILKEEVENSFGIKAITIKADIKDEDQVKMLINKTCEEFGHIDVLVNNVGIAIDSTVEDKTVANFTEILNTNLIGTFLMCKHIGPIMQNQGYGSIINISSTNAIDSYYPYSMDYDASKAGVISLTHNFAISYAPNIRVNCIAPGWTETEAIKEMDEELIKDEYKHILLNRFADPKEIAECIFFVADKATYMNDSIIKIDGGRC